MGFLEQLKLAERIFTCLCQNPRCHEPLGGFHFPGMGGIVIFRCQKCGAASAFKNGAYGIVPRLLAPPPTPRSPAAPGL